MEERKVYVKTKCFIIGTGRNGSKLLSNILALGNNISLHGEVEKGPQPQFYKDYYDGRLKIKTVLNYWKATREERMQGDKEIYLEKNHLIVPMLNIVNICYPESKFIFLRRNKKDTIRSFLARGTYSEKDMAGAYGKARLQPKEDNIYSDFWGKYNNEQKIGWLVNEYERMCLNFLIDIDTHKFITVRYENLIDVDNRMDEVESIYRWLGIEGFDKELIGETFGYQIGSSSDEKETGKLPNGRIRK